MLISPNSEKKIFILSKLKLKTQQDRNRPGYSVTRKSTETLIRSLANTKHQKGSPLRVEKQLTEVTSARTKITAAQQIQAMMQENEKLRQSITSKQKIIDNITKSRDDVRGQAQQVYDWYRNSKSCLTSQKEEDQQSKKRIVKLPALEDISTGCSPKEDCNFTFANNFFKTPNSSRINMLQAFPQYHLKRKFFT
ncbi:hypothetical protein pb186bvf_011115 [Paramecium bursaria]